MGYGRGIGVYRACLFSWASSQKERASWHLPGDMEGDFALKLWVIGISLVLWTIMMVGYCSALAPQKRHAGIFVDAFWRAGMAFVVVFACYERYKGGFKQTWSEGWSRQLMEFKVSALTCFFLVGVSEVCCNAVRVRKGQRHSARDSSIAISVMLTAAVFCILFFVRGLIR